MAIVLNLFFSLAAGSRVDGGIRKRQGEGREGGGGGVMWRFNYEALTRLSR